MCVHVYVCVRNAKIVFGKRIKLSFFCHSKDNGMQWVWSCAARANSAHPSQSETKEQALSHKPRIPHATVELTDGTGKEVEERIRNQSES